MSKTDKPNNLKSITKAKKEKTDKFNTKIKKTKKINPNVKVRFHDVTKTFGKLVANDNISFDVHENEIHGLLGENGAGKSTLMSILFGLYKPTFGTIEIDGKIVNIKDPRQVNNLKIAMLPQHFKLVDNMSVFENVTLGYETLNGKSVKERKAFLKKLAEKYNFAINIEAKIEKLSIASMQKVEILKILWRNANIIIFDEPTSILTPQEITSFLKMIKNLKSEGKTIILITHKLAEIREVANRVSIIRKGKFIATKNVKGISSKSLAELMVGKAVDLNLNDIKRTKLKASSKVVLSVEKLSFKSSDLTQNLDNINFKIKAGEIVGIAAIDGNGQSELIKTIAGILKSTSGKIKIENKEIQNLSIYDHYYDFKGHQKNTKLIKELTAKTLVSKNKLKAGKKEMMLAKYLKDELKISKVSAEIEEINRNYQYEKVLLRKPSSLMSHIPEDRHKYGLVLDYTVAKNAVLQDIDFFTRWGLIMKSDIRSHSKFIVDKYDVRGVVNRHIKARSLSGGNQQKLILGREIERNPKLLLAVHPTRGLDVGAIRNVYENIISARNKGMSVLLLSGELDEIMQVSDRIMVMHNGKIVSITQREELSKLQLGSLMAGGKK